MLGVTLRLERFEFANDADKLFVIQQVVFNQISGYIFSPELSKFSIFCHPTGSIHTNTPERIYNIRVRYSVCMIMGDIR